MLDLRLLNELRDFDTALLANTIGFIDSTPTAEYYLSAAIQSVVPVSQPTVGIAFTCELDSSTPSNVAAVDLYWQQLEEMSQSKLPIIWVVKAIGERPEHECILGDGMATALRSVGCVGLVSDGYVRDIAGLSKVPFAAYCRGKAIHHCALRFCSINRPVEISGVTIRPGDVLHANDEGVIRLPYSCLSFLPESATRMQSFEHEAHSALRREDLSLRQKREFVQELIAEYGFADCVAGAKLAARVK